jgi:hypothetical protein
MAGHELIDAYVAQLRRRLPTDTVDELSDGLLESWHGYLRRGLTPAEAAGAAIAEFGPADRIADAFIVQAPGRRMARRLLATGPVFGLCWGASLVAAKAWTWPVPWVLPTVSIGLLLAVIATLVTAATARHSYRRTRYGLAAAIALTVIDATMVGGVAILAPAFVWPMAIAVPASLARIGLTLGALPRRRPA